MPLKHFVYRWDQIGSHMALGDIASGTGFERGMYVSALLVNGQEYDLGSAISIPEMCRGLESVEDWHSNVDHEHVRVNAANGINRVFSVLCRADDLKLPAELLGQCSEKVLVIISEQHSDRGQKNPLGRIAPADFQLSNLLGDKGLSTGACDRCYGYIFRHGDGLSG